MIIAFARPVTTTARVSSGNIAIFLTQGAGAVLTVGPPLLPIMYWTSKQLWLGRSS